MRDTNDRDRYADFEAHLDQGRQQPERIAGKPEYKRKRTAKRGAAPTSYNGIHRRRKKRLMW